MYTAVNIRAASAYKLVALETSVAGADAHQLINLLFDALLQSLVNAKGAMARKDIPTKGREIGRAVTYLEEGLKGGLNLQDGGDLALKLQAVYDYCLRRLTQANIKNDIQLLDEVIHLIEPLASGWKQIRARIQSGG